MADQSAFNLCRADTVARDIYYIIYSSQQPVVAVCINTAAVTSKVKIIIHSEVGIDEAVMVTPHRPHHARPGFNDAKFAPLIYIALAAVIT